MTKTQSTRQTPPREATPAQVRLKRQLASWMEATPTVSVSFLKRSLPLVLIALSMLVGCTPIRDSVPRPLAIRYGDAGLQIASCVDISAEHIYANVRSKQTNMEWVMLLDAEGQTELTFGVPISVSEAPAGMTATTYAVPYSPTAGEDVSVSIITSQAGETSTTAFFASVPWDDLGDQWFYTNGSRSDAACEPFRVGQSDVSR